MLELKKWHRDQLNLAIIVGKVASTNASSAIEYFISTLLPAFGTAEQIKLAKDPKRILQATPLNKEQQKQYDYLHDKYIKEDQKIPSISEE